MTMANRSRPTHSQASTLVMPTRKCVIPKVEMKLHIDSHYRYKVYTTGSFVSGHVDVSASQDTGIHEIQIFLLGVSNTRVDNVNIPQAASHIFLKLTMPIPDSSYPTARLLHAATTYTIPFHFVIPQHLTLNACNHRVINESLKENHLRLPPSVGNWDKDDFAPHMSRVSYCVRARTYDKKEAGSKAPVLGEVLQDIRVIPLTAEDAPLSITEHDKLYVMTKSRMLRRSILSPKLGNVTLSAHQPAPAMISSNGHCITPTTALIDLVFEPASIECHPPRITGVASKITAVTYYSAGNVHQYPNLRDWICAFGSNGRGLYSSSVALPTATVEINNWEKRIAARRRQDSGYDSDPISDTDHSANGRPQHPPGRKHNNKSSPYNYVVKLRVPVKLPVAKKQFIPTFHSCITSRVYVLGMTVTLSAPAGKGSSISLAVPLQIGVGPREGPRVDATGLPTFEAAMEDAALDVDVDVDAYLQPRTIRAPDIEFHSALPGYPAHASRTRSAYAPVLI
ncbi:arrestin [Xylaria nigripes]|nr:arrestin [Xylaria nigripes]